jgi:hypothetical protein
MGDIITVNCDGWGATAASPAERSEWIRQVLNHPGNAFTAEQLVAMADETLRGAAVLAGAAGGPVANSGTGGPLPPPDLMAELLAERGRP